MKNLILTTIIGILIILGIEVKSQIFTNYNTSNGLPDNYISGGIAVDKKNNTWCGTASGLAKFNDTIWKTYTSTDGLVDNYIKCVAIDKDNNVWIGTDFGVSKFNGKNWTTYKKTNGLISDEVLNIKADIDGNIWFATYSGISKFDGNNWTSYTTANGLSSNAINYITVDTYNNKWFGTQMGGILKYNNSVFTNISTSSMDSLIDNNIFSLAVDSKGNKWVGALMGMSKLDKMDNWSANFRQKDGLFNNFIRDIDIDSKDNIWIGMYADYNQEGGITKFDGTNWTSYSINNGLVNAQVISMAIDMKDNLWVATGGGISKFTDNTSINQLPSFNSQFSIGPNPADNVIYIKHKNLTIIKLMDITGSLIIDNQINETNSIDVSKLNSGLYILQLIEGNNVHTTKIIKN